MRVMIQISILADTDRPAILAENLTTQVRHMLADEPDAVVGNQPAVILDRWTELKHGLGTSVADNPQKTTNQPGIYSCELTAEQSSQDYVDIAFIGSGQNLLSGG